VQNPGSGIRYPCLFLPLPLPPPGMGDVGRVDVGHGRGRI